MESMELGVILTVVIVIRECLIMNIDENYCVVVTYLLYCLFVEFICFLLDIKNQCIFVEAFLLLPAKRKCSSSNSMLYLP